MDAERKEEIRARVEAATPPTWHGDNNNPCDEYWAKFHPEDEAFIAHSRDDIPDLLAALDAAEQRAAELEAHLRAVINSASDGRVNDFEAAYQDAAKYLEDLKEKGDT